MLEHPPNGQGLAALVALNLVEGYDLAGMGYFDPARWHLMIEAMRLGMADAGRYVADPASYRCRSKACCRRGMRLSAGP